MSDELGHCSRRHDRDSGLTGQVVVVRLFEVSSECPLRCNARTAVVQLKMARVDVKTTKRSVACMTYAEPTIAVLLGSRR